MAVSGLRKNIGNRSVGFCHEVAHLKRQKNTSPNSCPNSCPCVSGAVPVSLPRSLFARFHAPFPVLPAQSARDPEGGGDRLPPADAARRHDPPGGGRDLCLPAARPAGADQGLPDRARGAGPLRRHRAFDADHPVRRSLARKRPLRGLWQGDAAHQGPPRARHALRPDQRGNDHGDLPHLRALVQGSAAQPLPHPMEVPRRGAAALRPDARARIPDEGRLLVRRRFRRRQARL